MKHSAMAKVVPIVAENYAGQSLRRWRENLGLTLRDVYRASVVIAVKHHNTKLVMSPSRLCDIETKRLIPNIYRVYTLALIYHREVRDILNLYGLNRSNLRECLHQG